MKGIYSALLGAADAQGRVDKEGLRSLVRHNIEHCKVDGLYVNGSTGESFLMPLEARAQTLRVAAEAARGEVKLIAHIGGNVAEEVRALSRVAQEAGYDAISAVSPFYYKFTADEICAYYRAIAAESALPLIAYYIPQLTGTTLSCEALLGMLGLPNVAGIKFTSNDFFTMERLRVACPDKLIYSGYDEMLLSACVLGTDGAIGSTYNIIGHWAGRVYRAGLTGDVEAARVWQGHMNHVITELIQAGLYQTIKEVAALYGVPLTGCRPPMAPTNEGHRRAAEALYAYITAVDAAK